MDKFIKDKIRKTCENILWKNCEKKVLEIESLDYIEAKGYKASQEIAIPDENWMPFGRYDRIYGKDKHFWFHTNIETPKVADNEAVELEVVTGAEGLWAATNPQGLLYLDGKAVQGLDTNHTRIRLECGRVYDIIIYFYTGMTDFKAEINLNLIVKNLDIEKLFYDIKVPYDAAMCFDDDDYNHIKTIKHLEAACNIIDSREPLSDKYFESIKKAREYLKNEYYGKECGGVDAVVSYVGHTHIDVAWLWTLDQTKEKVQRSFATVLKLMEEYPEYIFMSSQPQLYEYLKEEDPELYERVKDRVREGRWEVEGAMWLEADCNLSSGESLIRQIIFGKRFIKDEFGHDSRVLWLPDVFGYSAALPQILKKSGVDKFFTSKISWNESNQMPYDSFMWEGIDGTEIFSYFLTAQNHTEYLKRNIFTDYVGNVTPNMHLGTWERYQQKEYNNETIVTFGYGDGGGGSTREMIETLRRLEKGIPGMPKARTTRAGEFLDRVEKKFKKNSGLMRRTPKWVGELYLELHRGTYTSIGKNKKNNRECEFLCQSAETLSVLASLLRGKEYPKKILDKSWKTLLLNQFHDIIPGSSIAEVYEESDRQYENVRNALGDINKDCLEDIAKNVCKKGVLVYNPNSFKLSGYVNTETGLIYVENVPAMGWRVTEASDGGEVWLNEHKIESDNYIILFDENMNITSIYDKKFERQIIKDGDKLNRLVMFEDYPKAHDNWEISSFYKQKAYPLDDVECVKEIRGKGFGGFKIRRRYINSVITQCIIVYGKSRRIDVINDIDWHEHHTVMKAVFPIDIHTNKATYEIQFGNIERANHQNTSWDAAKFEVCAHKWIDISENGYGVSILNNCKYGHAVDGNQMSITLIKCGTYPNPEADQGKHAFTYSLYPHEGRFAEGGTIKEAYLLNRPLMTIETNGGGKLPAEYSLIKCDCENIVIETVKQAENGRGIIVRLYDAWNRKSNPTLKFGFKAERISLCDMLENPIEEVGKGDEVKLSVRNFEIVTVLLEL